jgi:hypothetical protein
MDVWQALSGLVGRAHWRIEIEKVIDINLALIANIFLTT